MKAWLVVDGSVSRRLVCWLLLAFRRNQRRATTSKYIEFLHVSEARRRSKNQLHDSQAALFEALMVSLQTKPLTLSVSRTCHRLRHLIAACG